MKKKICVLLLPFAAFIVCFVVSKLFIALIDITHYQCPIRFVTGFLCPGCGATRALKFFLKADFISSLRCNPTIILGTLSLILIYVRILFSTFGINKKIIPENKVFYFIISGIIFTYLIIRNFIPALQPV